MCPKCHAKVTEREELSVGNATRDNMSGATTASDLLKCSTADSSGRQDDALRNGSGAATADGDGLAVQQQKAIARNRGQLPRGKCWIAR